MDNLNKMLASGQITPFSGDSKLFKTCKKSVQKFALLERVTPDKLKLVVFRASTGAVSDSQLFTDIKFGNPMQHGTN